MRDLKFITFYEVDNEDEYGDFIEDLKNLEDKNEVYIMDEWSEDY